MLPRHMFCNPQLQQTFAELAEIIHLGKNQYHLFFPLPKSALLQLNESGGYRKPGAAASRAQPAACRTMRCQLSHLLCSQTSLFWCEIRLGVRGKCGVLAAAKETIGFCRFWAASARLLLLVTLNSIQKANLSVGCCFSYHGHSAQWWKPGVTGSGENSSLPRMEGCETVTFGCFGNREAS